MCRQWVSNSSSFSSSCQNPRQSIDLHEKVYIGDAEREKIERVKRRIGYAGTDPYGPGRTPVYHRGSGKEREQDFVTFFNKAISITPKLHMLHLLPGIGKKLMWEILEERNKKPFASFADISARIKSIPHPEKMIQARILEELQDKDVKYHVFTSQ